MSRNTSAPAKVPRNLWKVQMKYNSRYKIPTTVSGLAEMEAYVIST
jgi:hypothetical protein